MAILESCCGCGLAVSSAVLGVYLLVAYAIAFAIELLWILESPATPPIPAYLLCIGYFILLLFSALLLHGLSVKRTTFLLVWLFMMGILLGPEAGLVLYLSIHFWRVTSLYGLVEVTCWACRLVVNAVGLLCVQSLHSLWREEKSVLLRLKSLKTSPPTKAQGRQLSISSMFRGCKNAGCEKKDFPLKDPQEKADADPFGRLRSHHKCFGFKEKDYDCNYIDARYADGSEFSEFNASSFDPTVIDARLENMPYLTIRKKPKQFAGTMGFLPNEKEIIPKTRSLIDFRDEEFPDDENIKHSKKLQANSPSFLKKDLKNTANPENNTNSLDRKIIKNKNLKILKRLSPFYNRKPIEVNIYQINPPKGFGTSNLDSQLNKVYSNRGMYMFDEKLKKVLYYPPEFFNKSMSFRNRMDSYGSSQSRSSVDTDSEDIKHISDVAL